MSTDIDRIHTLEEESAVADATLLQQQQMIIEKERLATQERINNINNQTKLIETAAKLEGQN